MYNIFKYKKYEKTKTENGYIVKTVFWKLDKYGEISTITEFNTEGLPLFQTTYSDENLKDLVRTSKIEYSEDKSHTIYEIYTNNQAGWLSIIGKYDEKGKQLESKEFTDNNFQDMLREGVYIYNKNGSYIEKIKDYETKCSAISYYDKNGIEKKIIRYNDMNYTQIASESKLKFLKNGNVIFYEVLKDRNPFESRITVYDSRQNMQILSEKWYLDKNFKKLSCTCYDSYLEDGSLERKGIYNNYSVIEKYDKENKYQWTKYFKDKKCKNLNYTIKEENLESGNIIRTVIYENQNNKEYLSYKAETDRYYNWIWCEWYKDKEMKIPYQYGTYKYLENGNCIFKYQFKDKNDAENMSAEELRDENDRAISRNIYKDEFFEKLVATDEYIYEDNGNYSVKTVFTEPYKGYLSLICYYRKNKLYTFAYYDNSFQNLYRTSWGKKNKKGERVFLRIYEKAQDCNYISEIEKLDNNKNIIYCKKYKFKGILPRLIYIFSN